MGRIMFKNAASGNTNDLESQLIAIYLFICDQYDAVLKHHCQRFSNNAVPIFTDEEALTVYIFGILQNQMQLKDIYRYTRTHLLEWFPDMPSYTAFVNRINRLNNVFPVLNECLLNKLFANKSVFRQMLTDSMPIIVANSKRSNRAKSANEIADKGYCSSKGIYYHGVKLHIIAQREVGTLPIPIAFTISSASEHDLLPLRAISNSLHDIELFADKAYKDETEMAIFENQNVKLYIPVKKTKAKKHLDYFEQIYSTSVSRVRQPIESLFAWLQEKTKIQNASKTRSYKGLLAHVFGKICAACFILSFNP
jgi:hypothetical protein